MYIRQSSWTRYIRDHRHLSKFSKSFSDEERFISCLLNFNESHGRSPAPDRLQEVLRGIHRTNRNEDALPVFTKECLQTGCRYSLTFRHSLTEPGLFDFVVQGCQRPEPMLEALPEAAQDTHPGGYWRLFPGEGQETVMRRNRRQHLCDLPHRTTFSRAAWQSHALGGASYDDFCDWAGKIFGQVILHMGIDRAVILNLRREWEIIHSYVRTGKYVPEQPKRQRDEEEVQEAGKRARVSKELRDPGDDMVEKIHADMERQRQEQEDGSASSRRTSTATQASSKDSPSDTASTGISRLRRKTAGQKPMRYMG